MSKRDLVREARARRAKRRATSKPNTPASPTTPEAWAEFWQTFVRDPQVRADYFAARPVPPVEDTEPDDDPAGAWHRLAAELGRTFGR